MDLLKRIEELENKMNFLIQRQGEHSIVFIKTRFGLGGLSELS